MNEIDLFCTTYTLFSLASGLLFEMRPLRDIVLLRDPFSSLRSLHTKRYWNWWRKLPVFCVISSFSSKFNDPMTIFVFCLEIWHFQSMVAGENAYYVRINRCGKVFLRKSTSSFFLSICLFNVAPQTEFHLSMLCIPLLFVDV